MKKLSQYFFQGLIFVVPIAITAYVLYLAFVKIDSWLQLPVKGAGFLITIAMIFLIGFLASNFLTKSGLALIEKIFQRLPFVKLLHSSIKDVLTAFVGEKKKFDKPVLVDLFPGGGAKAIGFVTRESFDYAELSDQVAVYFPQSFNFAGNLILYPKSSVKPILADSPKVMAFVVSCGVSEF
jgi:uncharacterized membrane protein